MSDLSFAEPQCIHLIWAVVATVAVLVWLDQRGSSGLDRFLSPLMQVRLAARPKRSRRLARLGLLGLGGLFLVVALMRPQSGVHFVRTPRVGAQIMVCLDVSRSMLAEDAAPNRLRRAKAEILDLLAFLEDDHVGLTAFAGKATVLCPLTPDFGFLRLVLDTAGPQSVARGGTNLEAPIRKALDGFKGQSDLSRAVILITDGEDHDSFALEAAKAAAERGVRIIAIGFGDEAGSHVEITDPDTGARTRLLDADGKPVVTRLDGELLRKIALETDGAYVPAGTGALDLKAIYDAHIAPLTTGRLDHRGRLVKQERYQWAVLAALLCLVAAATAASGRSQPRAARASASRAAAFLWITFAVLPLGAAQSDEAPKGTNADPQAAVDSDDETPVSVESPEDEDVDPRLVFNEAVQLYRDNHLDGAEEKLALARSRAGSDGAVRYRSTYNLGWVEVSKADEVIEKEPQRALEHLHAAANWFREAVDLQKDEIAPRQNLEIVARRAMALADALAKKDEKDLAAAIDELIDQQRALATLLQSTVQRVADQPTIPDHLRSEFRSLEVQQRRILSRVDEIAEDARQEAAALEDVQKQKRTPEQKLRMAQLEAVQAYLNQAAQRVGQTRRDLRGRQAQRAYRRASAALGQMKRARDQLRDLVQLLGSLIQDATVLARQTGDLAAPPTQGLTPDEPAHTPDWLTPKYVAETLEIVRGRTGELVARIEAGLAGSQAEGEDQDTAADSTRGPTTAPAHAPADQDAQRQHLIATLHDAAPLVRSARDEFEKSNEALVSQRLEDAYQAQAAATAELLKARELFLDVRGLIEVMYGDQKQMQAVLNPKEESEADPVGEYAPLFGHWVDANGQRAARLDGVIVLQLDQLTAGEAQDSSAAEEDQAGGDQEAQRQRLEFARQLLGGVRETLDQTGSHVDALNADVTDEDVLARLRDSVDTGVDQIEALRRLFFSIVEHLKETARRQAELGDETRDASTLEEEEQQKAAIAPLAVRQRGLSSISRQIADSLSKQAEQPPPGGLDAKATGAEPDGGVSDEAQRLGQAAQRVGEAADAMDGAAGGMDGDAKDIRLAQEHQETAFRKLVEALQLLEPPPPPPQQDPNQNQQPPQDQQQQDGLDKQKAAQPQPRQMDMSHLLQAVRDREAQRQRSKRQAGQRGYAPVEKDW